MITLGIKCGRESENVRRTKFNAKPAGFATFNFDLNGTFRWHEIL
jgi:hypothetical protein